MTNLECIVAVLEAHREARQWTDESVAADLVAQLGLDPAAAAKNAKPVVPPGITEDEVVAHENAAKEAMEKAKAAREALNAQKADEKPTPASAQAGQTQQAAHSDLNSAMQNTHPHQMPPMPAPPVQPVAAPPPAPPSPPMPAAPVAPHA